MRTSDALHISMYIIIFGVPAGSLPGASTTYDILASRITLYTYIYTHYINI